MQCDAPSCTKRLTLLLCSLCLLGSPNSWKVGEVADLYTGRRWHTCCGHLTHSNWGKAVTFSPAQISPKSRFFNWLPRIAKVVSRWMLNLWEPEMCSLLRSFKPAVYQQWAQLFHQHNTRLQLPGSVLSMAWILCKAWCLRHRRKQQRLC